MAKFVHIRLASKGAFINDFTKKLAFSDASSKCNVTRAKNNQTTLIIDVTQ